jgi:predicted metal-binding membrane protein
MMAALFALGVMSVTWMALVATLVAFEKLGPVPRAAMAATAAVLLALSIGILTAPHHVPGFVIPSSPGALHAMKGMR